MKRLLLITISIFVICLIFSGAVYGSNKKCLTCHLDSEEKDSQGKSINIDMETFDKSVHGQIYLECVACHEDLSNMDNPSHKKVLNKVDCSGCHEDEGKEYSRSIHGTSSGSGDIDAATCVACHGSHDIKAIEDKTSLTHHTNIPELCIKCHLNEKIVDSHAMDIGKVEAYMDSVHYKALKEKGLTISATCTDCHMSHGVKKINKEKTHEDKLHLLDICAKCHEGIYNDYVKSIHGKAFEEGIDDSPICTDCHGEHTIKSHLLPEASTYATHIGATCTACHDNEKINTRYDLSALRMKTYKKSYHGVAITLGDVTVANCGSCHGYHDILPSTDPASSINPKNLGKTCAKCHPGSAETFIESKIHESNTEMHIIPRVIRLLYIILIVCVIGGFVFYIILDLFGIIRRAGAKKAGLVKSE